MYVFKKLSTKNKTKRNCKAVYVSNEDFFFAPIYLKKLCKSDCQVRQFRVEDF